MFRNIYTCNDGAERKLFLETVINKLQNHRASDYLFLNCNFSCREDDTIDRNHTEPHQGSQYALRHLLFCHGLVDVEEDACGLQTVHMVPL